MIADNIYHCPIDITISDNPCFCRLQDAEAYPYFGEAQEDRVSCEINSKDICTCDLFFDLMVVVLIRPQKDGKDLPTKNVLKKTLVGTIQLEW